MLHKYQVTGFAPAHSKEANALLKSFDLGIDGAFIEQSMIVTVHMEAGVTSEQLARQPDAIKQSFEESGWRDVEVKREI